MFALSRHDTMANIETNANNTFLILYFLLEK